MKEIKLLSGIHRRWTAFKLKRRNRSLAVDISLMVFLAFFGFFSAAPLILTISSAFKPMSEIFLFPPRFWVQNPTLNNFFDLGTVLTDSKIILGRYIFNTAFITSLGMLGTVLLGSMAAFPLAKYVFPGSGFMSHTIVYSLMFNGAVTAIPSYLIMSKLGLVDTYLAVILPVIAGTLGLYLMQSFMTQIPTELIEAAKIDGKGEFNIFFTIIMPLSRPAWITLIILSFNSLWGNTGGTFIYTESLKPLSFMLSQIIGGGIARTGVAAAVGLVMLTLPITVFIISQSNVIETMATSGLKG
ncbi:MAG: carbohydrate ABC transporter permease [Treponema sp.]|jgi:ABC-type glycerol-3-phosphate transport system permease component|nr:carbohydrate ABC transporter permease [Treponema sp.]